ncbi:GvpL/GvpF family gas vesicle protein [Candidatus Gracilibacteria bacterium]|nr:GvpL/GvpF family gas vesicle protein [Candidatus Gracilibacteria bacterium]
MSTAEGLYLYGIIRCAETRSFATPGIGGRGDGVFTLHHGELAAVVSQSPIVEYDGNRRNMMAHTRVLEEVMAERSVLPMRFGIIAPDSATITEQLLARHGADLQRQLSELEGRVELGLKAFWDEQRMMREAVEHSSAIRELRDRLQGRSAAETHFERIRLGEMIESVLHRRRDEDATIILNALQPLAYRSHISPTIGERMVVNAAFLLDRTRETAFDAAVNALDERFAGRLSFKYVGPLPAYNFVTLTMTWGCNGMAYRPGNTAGFRAAQNGVLARGDLDRARGEGDL